VFDLDSLEPAGEVPNVNGHGAVVDPKTNHGFVTSNPVLMFDSKTLAVIKTINVQGNPDGILFDPYNERVYDLSHSAPNATVIDAKDGSIVGTIDLHKLIGRNITNGSQTVGEINSVMTGKDGNVKYVVVGVGGFLGIGEKEVALPWKDLAISENGEKVTANVTKEQLKAMPEHRFVDAARRGTVYSYDEDLKANPYLADNEAAVMASSAATPRHSSRCTGRRSRAPKVRPRSARSMLPTPRTSCWRGSRSSGCRRRGSSSSP
jgi:DNA-binding beta-propeller fold protein YncE